MNRSLAGDPLDWSPPADPVPGLDTSKAPPARRYDYWLGGKDNFAADRESGDRIAEMFPTIKAAVRQNRLFLQRAVGCLSEEGVAQFLDIGCGLPSANNTHEVAEAINPAARTVYVDNDPTVLAHARALLTSGSSESLTAYFDADVRESEKILAAAQETLDFGKPVALMLVAIMHFIPDLDEPTDLVARLVRGLPSGSYLALSHATGDYVSDEVIAEAAGGPAPTFLRSRQEITHFFDGLDLLPPGIVSSSEWRAPEGIQRPSVEETGMHCGVARIP